jgi:hypothetical protein
MTNSIHLTQLARELLPRYTTPLPHLARTRFLTGTQLDQLLAEPDTTTATTARQRRRIMTRLIDLGIITTLSRRIGGVRAGSAGHIYTLTPTGHRITATLTGQPHPPHVKKPATPSMLFLAHALVISDIYVRLIQTSREHPVTLSCFMTEPHCWQPTEDGNFLKPDAYCVLATSTHRDCWWLEIDQATEPLTRIRAKCRTYLDYLTHSGLGPDQVPPRVLYTTPNTPRCEAINNVTTQLSTQDNHLIGATTHTDAPTFLINELLAT